MTHGCQPWWRSTKALWTVMLTGALVCAIMIGASTARAANPFWTISIPSSGGWVKCGATITPSVYRTTVKSVQGSRHPYRAAHYPASGSPFVSGYISNDNTYDTDNYGYVAQRFNNFAGGGNGLYYCEHWV